MVQIEDLSVGTVAGLIAAGVFTVNFIMPMIFPLIMVGGLKPENTAATWSVVGRSLHRSHWPVILRSDSAGSTGVRGGVRLLSLFEGLLLLLVGVASIVTPLGLYETITPRTNLQEVDFSYAADNSSLGQGTLLRDEDFGLSRSCWGVRPNACIWSDTVITETMNSTTYTADIPDGYDVRIPKNITEIYSAGLSKLPKTVSSVFDIQWRTYKKVLQTKYQRAGQSYLVGDYRQLSQLVLNDAWEAITGLIVNTKTGGVGFRNHTAPPKLPFGSTWSEDLLFIEPETECVDLNITMDFKIPESADEMEAVVNVSITDRGGFANINKDIPWYDTNKTWASANLRDRAYFAAWFSNVYTMFYLNVTNPKNEKHSKRFEYIDSTVGKKFKVQTDSLGSFKPTYDMLMIKKYGDYLNIPELGLNGSVEGDPNYSNPWKISTDNFTDIAPACANALDSYRANITNIAVQCGMILGAARRSDGSPSLLFDPGTEWTIPLYSCASAAKASIKSVEFRYNGTEGLKSLDITKIEPKKYAKEEDKPLWAVENLNQRLRDGNPVWGITLPEHENHPNISTARQESLYLPGYSPLGSAVMGTGPSKEVENFAGIDFYSAALTSAYQMDSPDAMSMYTIPDYTGKTSLAMYSKWQRLSNDSTSAASIINLIWTDISANAVVGTKSQLPSQPLKDLAKRDGPQTTVKVPVKIYSRHVKFHILYGIPAFLALAVVILLLSVALFYVILGKATPSSMRRYLSQTSTGRILTTFLYTNDCPPNANTNDWANRVGKKRVHLGGLHPRAMDTTTGPALAPSQGVSTAVAGGAVGAAPTTAAYGKMDEATISMHSLPSPQPYSPVNHMDGAAQSYYNQEPTAGSPYTYVPPGSGMLNPNGEGYTEFRTGNASPRAL